MKSIALPFFFILCLGSKNADAQKISINCRNTRLSEILHMIDSLQSKQKIHYEEEELEDYWLRIFNVNELAAKAAVRKACEGFPVSVTQKNNDIYIVNNRKNEFCYRGRILNEEEDIVKQAHAQLLNPYTNDIYTRANVAEDGRFCITSSHNPVVLHISAPGYKEKYFLCRRDSIGDIHLFDDAQTDSGRHVLRLTAQPIIGTSVRVEKPGTLTQVLTQAQSDTCTALIVSGILNSDDIRHLRHMAGYKEENCTTGRLQKLDMSEVEFVNDRRPYMTLDAAKENLISSTETETHWGGLQEDMTRRTAPITYHTELLNERDPWYRGRNSLEDKSYWKRNKDMSIAYFKPKHTLNADPDLGTSGISIAEDRTWACVKYAGKQVSKKDLKKLRKYNLTQIKGHTLNIVNERIQWSAHSKRNYISLDMFYKCQNLKEVIIPRKIQADKSIIVKRQKIWYREPIKE